MTQFRDATGNALRGGGSEAQTMLHRIRRIRVIFDPDFKAGAASTDEARAYDVTATTVRIGLSGAGFRKLDPAADAEGAAACGLGRAGECGHLLIGRRSGWLGDGQGQGVGHGRRPKWNKRVGHKQVASLFGTVARRGAFRRRTGRCSVPRGSMRFAEFGGGRGSPENSIRRRRRKLDVAEVTKALWDNLDGART